MPPAVAAPPPTQVEPVTEILHGVEVTDPYRWLEDQNSPRTRAWLEEQTAYTRAYFDAIPGREQIRERVRELHGIQGSYLRTLERRRPLLFPQASGRQRAACHRDAKRVIRRGDSSSRPSSARNRDFDCRFYCRDFSGRSVPGLFCATRRNRSLVYRDSRRRTESPCFRIVFQKASAQGLFLRLMAQGSTTLIASCAIRGPTIEPLSGIASAATDHRTLKCFSRAKSRISFLEFSIHPKPISWRTPCFLPASIRPPRSTCTA